MVGSGGPGDGVRGDRPVGVRDRHRWPAHPRGLHARRGGGPRPGDVAEGGCLSAPRRRGQGRDRPSVRRTGRRRGARAVRRRGPAAARHGLGDRGRSRDTAGRARRGVRTRRARIVVAAGGAAPQPGPARRRRPGAGDVHPGRRRAGDARSDRWVRRRRGGARRPGRAGACPGAVAGRRPGIRRDGRVVRALPAPGGRPGGRPVRRPRAGPQPGARPGRPGPARHPAARAG